MDISYPFGAKSLGTDASLEMTRLSKYHTTFQQANVFVLLCFALIRTKFIITMRLKPTKNKYKLKSNCSCDAYRQKQYKVYVIGTQYLKLFKGGFKVLNFFI